MAIDAPVSRTKILMVFLVFVLSSAETIRAQDPSTRKELWPEIDVHVEVKPKVRLYFLATLSKAIEDGEDFSPRAYEAMFGASVDYIPDKHVMLRTGYRRGWSLDDDSYSEHRLITEQTFRKLLPGNFLLSDRNREDFRWLKGDFSFRYRNRVTIEKEFQLKKRSLTPYVSGELFYDTRFGIWNRNRVVVGVQTSLLRGPLQKMLLPKHQVILDLNYTHQNDSRAVPAHVNAFATVLSFYF